MTFAIVDKENDALIGAIGLHRIDRQNMTAATGTSIGNKEYWGKGYGTEAKMLLLEFAFNELNLRKIYSDVIGYNERSLKYAKKCGYVEEARLPEHYFRKGKYWDKVILAVYSKEWQELWKNFTK
jgi:RimJ/RimL family protein N-acetyltransferase